MPSTINVFQGIGGTIDNAMGALVESLSARLIEVITPWAIAGVILYFTLYGYLLIVGGIREPFYDFLMKCCRIIIVGGLALNTTTYLTWIVEGFRYLEDALTAALSGAHIGKTMYAALDDTLGMGWEVIKACLQMAGSAGWTHMGAMLVWGINALILFIGFALAMVVGGVSILVSHAMIKIAFAVGPLCIMCMMWPATARFFDSWVHFVLNHILIVVLTTAMLAISVEVYAHEMAQVKMHDPYQNVTRVSCELLIIAAALHALMKGAIAMAVKLAGGFSAEFLQAMGTAQATMRGMQWMATTAWRTAYGASQWISRGMGAKAGPLANSFRDSIASAPLPSPAHSGSISSTHRARSGESYPAYRRATLDYLQKYSSATIRNGRAF